MLVAGASPICANPGQCLCWPTRKSASSATKSPSTARRWSKRAGDFATPPGYAPAALFQLEFPVGKRQNGGLDPNPGRNYYTTRSNE
jgi:hypothetical protein